MLNHVALTVSDRERSAAFYREHFGLTERIFEDGHLLILGATDDSELALSDAEPVPTDLPRTNHFGFRLADEAAVHAARERFRAAAVPERNGRTTAASPASRSSTPTATGSRSTRTEGTLTTDLCLSGRARCSPPHGQPVGEVVSEHTFENRDGVEPGQHPRFAGAFETTLGELDAGDPQPPDQLVRVGRPVAALREEAGDDGPRPRRLFLGGIALRTRADQGDEGGAAEVQTSRADLCVLPVDERPGRSVVEEVPGSGIAMGHDQGRVWI
ncbi:MAG TPA: VOC family protein [Solirubrobacterales bacterium]|nr:VOC family protein [Solirubrobacterales bacterium]